MENLGDTRETGSFDLKWVQDGELPDVGSCLPAAFARTCGS